MSLIGLIGKALSGKMSTTEKKLCSSIKDPQQRQIQQLQIEMQHQALVATTVTNCMNMIYEREKGPAGNLRS